jgi:hypothetical protein
MLLLGYVLPQCIGAGSAALCQNRFHLLVTISWHKHFFHTRRCDIIRLIPKHTSTDRQDEMYHEMDDSAGSGE